jgi:hypothetical protein
MTIYTKHFRVRWPARAGGHRVSHAHLMHTALRIARRMRLRGHSVHVLQV